MVGTGIVLVSLVGGQSAMAANTVIYDNIPVPFPGNVPSVGFEATSTSEFGGLVSFAPGHRRTPTVSFLMSSWACEHGTWNGHDCGTTSGATFTLPITIRMYTVDQDNQPAELIGLVKHTFAVPYRPSANNSKCLGDDAGKWYQATTGTRYNGKAVLLTVQLGQIDLPDTAIVSVSYNTTHFGYHPIGEAAACYGTPTGCPYDALNVGTSPVTPPLVGAQPLPNDAYVYSSWGGAYCDGGAGGTDTFRLDSGCWGGYQPGFRVKAKKSLIRAADGSLPPSGKGLSRRDKNAFRPVAEMRRHVSLDCGKERASRPGKCLSFPQFAGAGQSWRPVTARRRPMPIIATPPMPPR